MLRMLKPDPMPAADRDGQPYLKRRECGWGLAVGGWGRI